MQASQGHPRELKASCIRWTVPHQEGVGVLDADHLGKAGLLCNGQKAHQAIGRLVGHSKIPDLHHAPHVAVVASTCSQTLTSVTSIVLSARPSSFCLLKKMLYEQLSHLATVFLQAIGGSIASHLRFRADLNVWMTRWWMT